MGTISQSRELGMTKLESGEWAYVPKPAALPTLPPPPTYPAAPNQYLRGPLPADMWQDPDAQRQFHAAAIPQTRLSPLPANADPISGAQAASQAIQIIQSTPAKSSSGVTSVGLTMPGIFISPVSGSPVTSSGTLAVALANEPFNTVFAGPTSTQGSIALDVATAPVGTIPGNTTLTVSYNGVATAANDFALLAIASTNATPNSVPTAPWTQLAVINSTNVGGGVFWQNSVSAGTVPASVTWTKVGSSTTTSPACMVTLKTSGGTPSVRQSNSVASAGILPGGNTTLAMPGATLAGSAIFVVIQGSETINPPFSPSWIITDTQNNNYTLVDSVVVLDVIAGDRYVAIYAAPSAQAAACTLTFTNLSGSIIGAGIVFYIQEVTNLAPPVFTPSFRGIQLADLPGFTNSQLQPSAGGTGSNLSATGGANQVLQQTTSGGAITVGQLDFNNLAGAVKISKYNNINTVSNGVPSELATVDLTAQSAAIATTTLYAVPASGVGQYRVSWNAKVTTVAGTSSTLGPLTIVYTDPDGVAQTITCAAQSNAGVIETSDSGNLTTTVMLGHPLQLNCKASTNVTYAFSYASNAAAAMNYNLHIICERL